MKINQFESGQMVHYTPRFGDTENGVVKSKHPNLDAYFVVYKCDGNWDNYSNYTAALTDTENLKDGWENL